MSTTPPIAADTTTATTWRLDPARSSVEFQVPHFWGLMKVKGSFSEYEGILALGAAPSASLTIDAASVNTKQGKRDQHLRSKDFFNVEHHPKITFTSDSASLDGEALTVRGTLHVAAGQLPLALDATLRPVGEEFEIEASAPVDQRQLGITWSPLGVTRTPSVLTVKGRLVRADTPAA